jgi:hypothetical protein
MRFTPLIYETGKKKWYAVQVVEFLHHYTPSTTTVRNITNTTNNPKRCAVWSRHVSVMFAGCERHHLIQNDGYRICRRIFSHAPSRPGKLTDSPTTALDKYTHDEFPNTHMAMASK